MFLCSSVLVMRIYALIPAYNEEKSIRTVVADVKRYVDEAVVIDDGSSDATSSEASAGGAFVLRHVVNRGQGAALQTGFDFVRETELRVAPARPAPPDAVAAEARFRNRGLVVVTFDADGQFEASEIPHLIGPVVCGDVDVTLGSRFLGKSINMPLLKRLLLRLAVWFSNITIGVRLTDTHNGFRALSASALQTIQIIQDRMAHGSEIVAEIEKHNLRYVELPVTVRYSEYSKAKGQKFLDYFKIIFDLFVRKLVQ